MLTLPSTRAKSSKLILFDLHREAINGDAVAAGSKEVRRSAISECCQASAFTSSSSMASYPEQLGKRQEGREERMGSLKRKARCGRRCSGLLFSMRRGRRIHRIGCQQPIWEEKMADTQTLRRCRLGAMHNFACCTCEIVAAQCGSRMPGEPLRHMNGHGSVTTRGQT